MLPTLNPSSFLLMAGALMSPGVTLRPCLQKYDRFLENVPFWPLQQPARKLDAILAIDAVSVQDPDEVRGSDAVALQSADTSDNYPNGTAPYTTYLKSQLPAWSAYKSFPKCVNSSP